MRLTDHQQAVILEILRERLGDDIEAFVFGSRLDDHAQGGDLDLLVESPGELTLMQKAGAVAALEKKLSLPVDLLTCVKGSRPKPFIEIARHHAVRLGTP
jgi:predicted nucleotidyltransferase